ncbi:hypothetical protein [Geopseudomonas aromaticivorans]
MTTTQTLERSRYALDLLASTIDQIESSPARITRAERFKTFGHLNALTMKVSLASGHFINTLEARSIPEIERAHALLTEYLDATEEVCQQINDYLGATQ